MKKQYALWEKRAKAAYLKKDIESFEYYAARMGEMRGYPTDDNDGHTRMERQIIQSIKNE